MNYTRHFNKAIILSLALFAASATLAFAWTEPSSSPPAGNVTAPVNVGATTQSKSGAFSVLGNFGVGTASPGYPLEVSGTNGTISVKGTTPLYVVNDATHVSYLGSASPVVTGGVAGDLALRSNDASILFAISSSEKMRINNNGNVGIGTASPTTVLQVAGQSVTPANGFAVTTNSFTLGSSGSGVRIGTGASSGNTYGQLDVLQSGGTLSNGILAINPSGGNVGIGTTAPTAKEYILGSGTQYQVSASDAPQDLAVEGTNAGLNSATLTLWTNDTPAANAGGSIGLGGRYNTGINAIWARLLGGKENATAGNTAGYLALFTRPNGGSNTERLRIDSTGNVGIGTTAPNDNFQIGNNGNNSMTIGLQASGGSTSQIRFLPSNSQTNWQISNNKYILGALEFTPSTAGGGSTFSTPAMTILSGGFVGIGTTAPAQRLEIAGNLEMPDASYIGWRYSGADANMYDYITHNYTVGGGIQYYAGSWTGSATLVAHDFFTSVSGVGWVSRLAILNNGNVGIGTTAPGKNLDVTNAPAPAVGAVAGFTNAHATAGDYVMYVNGGPNTTDSTTQLIRFQDAGSNTWQGWIGRGGANGTVTYNTTSDRRLKENIRPTNLGLNDLMKIQVEDFNFKADKEKNVINGLIAQNIENIYPEAVSTNGDDGKVALGATTTPWGIDYGRLTPLIVSGVQDLSKKVDDQQTKIDNLEARLAKLEASK